MSLNCVKFAYQLLKFNYQLYIRTVVCYYKIVFFSCNLINFHMFVSLQIFARTLNQGSHHINIGSDEITITCSYSAHCAHCGRIVLCRQ